MHDPDGGLDDRRILRVQLADIVAHLGTIEARGERQVGRVARHAVRIGDDDRHADLPDVLREIEERRRARAFRWVAECAEDPRGHQAGS